MMDAGVFEDEVVSMVDVLHEDNELEEEARAVLGDSDDQHCTYPAGYVNRQALYACGSCSPSDAEPAGICLACTLTCHEGHTLYELYTKRNFRCDCGNKKFPEFKCKLYSSKDPENTQNKYNQNFQGVYCTCHRPYPDLEDEIEDEMIQCVICEDWYHSRHLGSLPPPDGDFQEMICDDCMSRCSFLQGYLPLSVPSQQTSIASSQQVIKSETEAKPKVQLQPGNKSGEGNKAETNSDNATHEAEKSQQETSDLATQQRDSSESEPCVSQTPDSLDQIRKEEATSEPTHNGVKSETQTVKDCKVAQLQDAVTSIESRATYWHVGWRSNLCKCDKCMSLYKSLDVLYLTDESDTMMAYEERGRQKRPSVSSYESGMNALQNMGRIPQVEVLHEYNDMKSELTEFLRDFAAQGKVVKEEDIRDFFDSLQSRKRQRVGSANSVQYSCR
ncbi:putative E3 ubiquitin-protein ligase UBR7 [Porites lutea]|uniref:putative E3 ubiquitin-protein ligase UBR7 n=1 Tax=Porites lutea TaxID=51062 RepID=UPI003CC60B71